MPERFVPTLGVVVAGDIAVVLLGTDGDDPYPCEVVCHRRDGGWRSGSSGNAPGWASTTWDEAGDAPDIGVRTLWDQAPAGVGAAVIDVAGEEVVVPVRNGYYLFAAFGVPEDDVERLAPRLVRFTA